MVLGWDAEPPLRPELSLLGSLSAWRPNVDFGQPSVFVHFTQTPLALLYLLFSVPFGIVAAEKILLTIFFVLPAFTMYYCARRMFGSAGFVPLVAAVCYALCPLLFIRYYIPILPVQLAYALLPLLVNVWVDLVRNGARPVALLALAGVELALLPTASNLAYWLVPQGVAFAFALMLVLMQRRTSAHRMRGAGALVTGAVVIVLVNAFWLGPQAAFGIGEGAALEGTTLNRDYTTGIRRDIAANAHLVYTMRFSAKSVLTGADSNGPYFTYAGVLANGFVAGWYFIWILFPALAIGLRARDPRVIALGVLLGGAIFGMKGDAPPFEGVLDLFYKLPILGTIFRDSYDKLLPAAAFSASLLMPIGFNAVAHRVRPLRAWSLALAVVVVAMAFPFWTGQMFMARPKGPTLAAIPPAAAWSFARSLDSVDARVLFLPVGENPELLAMNWPYFGVNLYVNMTSAPVIASAEAQTNTIETNAVATQIYRAVEQGDVAHFVALTRAASVGYVFVAHDVDSNYYGGRTAGQADSFLGRLGGTRVVESAGPYALWHLDWVPPLSRDLVRRDIISSGAASLTAALMVAPQCGLPDATLLYYLVVPPGAPSCTITTSALAIGTGATPVLAHVAGGVLALQTGSAKPRTLPLPAGTSIASISYRAIATTPQTIALVPCARYPLETFATAGAAQDLSLASSRLGVTGLFLSLPALAPGWHAFTLHARAAEPKINATITDQISKDAVVIANGLTAPDTTLLMYALPGRSYELDVDGPVAFPRVYVESVAMAPAVRNGTSSFVAPSATGAPCPAAAPSHAFAVLDRPLRASRVAYDGQLLVRTYGIEPPLDVVKRPLAHGSSLIRTGTNLIGPVTADDMLYPGTPMLVSEYRTLGPSIPVSIGAVSTTGEQISAIVDPRHDKMTLRSLAPDQWAYFELPDVPPGKYAVTIENSALLGQYGAAIVNAVTAAPVTGQRNVTSPTITLEFRVLPGARYNLFLYLDILEGQATAALRVSHVSMVRIEESALSSLSIPSVAPSLPTNPNALIVERLTSTPTASAYVLDTQFDRFWVAGVLRSSFPFFTQLPHVTADAYKNAWIVPNPPDGRIVHFYVLDVMANAGLVLCALTLAWLAFAAARRRSRTAR